MYANNKSIVLPSGEIVFARDPIIPDCHFYWSEATHSLTRIPKNIVIEGNIYKAACEMEKIRKILGNFPLQIHSWYRNEAANKQTPKSATNSRHLHGDGIDFSCKLLSPDVIFNKLNSQHIHGGLAKYKTHIHIDFRGRKARW